MIGETISHYKILEKLGEGGMGVVYKAEDTNLKRIVALKFLPPELTRDPEAKKRFVHEARAAAALSHSNICTIHEIDEAEEQSFIAMEYMEGGSLKDKIEDNLPKVLNLREVLDIAAQVAQGLEKAHQQGIVHRDIKPANIFMTGDGVIKILDFGLAKLRGQKRLTKEGTTVGTVAYMSPEQARGDDVDQRTDIWSLGIMLYEMVTGQLPFKGDYEQAVIYSILNEEHEPMTGLRTGVPMELERVVNKALKKRSEERYQTVSDMLVDLRAVTEDVEPSKTKMRVSEAKRSRMKYVYICAAFLAILALIVLGRNFIFIGKPTAIDSIAVLPLENLSKDPEQEYFADGMTEALIADLAKISALRVISRTSVMRYKDTEKSLPEIAKDLDVDAIVEGSVLLAGDRVRITAQMIEAAIDRHIWAESYERDLRDILSLQRDVAKAIAHEIEVTLTPQEEVTLAAAPQVDPEAHEAYLKGRHHWNKRGKVDLERSVEYFRQAIEKDPDFAMAYVGLAEAYAVLGDWGFHPPRETYPKAMETALKALEIDPALASAHATIGAVQSLYHYDQRKAEEEYQRAISLSPNYATAHQWYAEYLFRMKRFDEALTEIERALDLDPLSLIMHCVRGAIYRYSSQYDRAIAAYDEALKLDRDFWVTHQSLIEIYLDKGMYDEAVESFVKLLTLGDMDEDHIASLEKAYRGAGVDGVNRWLVDVGYRLSDQLYNIPFYRASAFARMGEIDSTFVWLEKSYEAGTQFMLYIEVEPPFKDIRSDPRYEELLKKVGFME